MYLYSKMNKKGQAQMQESIVVMVIFFILLVIGLVFFYRYNLKSIESNKLSYERDRVYTMLSTLPNSPLMQKSRFLDEESAIDTIKMTGLKLEDTGFFNKLGYKSIIVKQVYPIKKAGLCDAKIYPDCDSYLLYENKPKGKASSMILSTPVSLYFPFTDSYGAGKLEITWWIE